MKQKKNIVVHLTTTRGRSFHVVLVQQGDRYGTNDCLTHEGPEPMLEFYDATNAGGSLVPAEGKFVSRYSVGELSRLQPHTALILLGGVPEWIVNADALIPVVALAQRLVAKEESIPHASPLLPRVAYLVEKAAIPGLNPDYLTILRRATFEGLKYLSWSSGASAALYCVPVDTNDRSPTRLYRVEVTVSWTSNCGSDMDSLQKTLDAHRAVLTLCQTLHGLTGTIPAT